MADEKKDKHAQEQDVGEVKIDSALMFEIEEEGRHTSSVRPFPGHVSERTQRAVSLALNLIPENNKQALKRTFSFSPLVDFLTSQSSSNHRPWVALTSEESKEDNHLDAKRAIREITLTGDAQEGDAQESPSSDGATNPNFRFTPAGVRSPDSVSPEELNDALRALRGYQKRADRRNSKKR